MQKVAKVVICDAVRGFDKKYSYRVPKEFEEQLDIGMRVLVPFGIGNRKLQGYVLEINNEEDIGSCLKELIRIFDTVPVIMKDLIKMVQWMKDQYICTYADAIGCMVPSGLGIKSVTEVELVLNAEKSEKEVDEIVILLQRQGGSMDLNDLKSEISSRTFTTRLKKLEEEGYIKMSDTYHVKAKEKFENMVYLSITIEEAEEVLRSDRLKRIQHVKVLEILKEVGVVSMQEIMRFSGVSLGTLETMKKMGLVGIRKTEVTRDPYKKRQFDRTYPLKPTEEQQTVLSEIFLSINQKQMDEVLLKGITGSGKTEVYLQLIAKVLSKNRQAIMLVPEISLTPQMVERFKGRFGEDVAVLHSRLSLGERYDQWRLVRDGKTKVVVGARSAVFAPFSDLGIIIIDEEHENTYRSESTPKYDARVVARERCRLNNAVLMYGSATPSVETYFRANNNEVKMHKMNHRPNHMILPKIKVIDMRTELNEGNRSIFSRSLFEEIQKNILRKEQTILFLNRRGYASFVLCRNCGYKVKCNFCNITMTYHSKDERLICHYCGYTAKMPLKCPTCASQHIKQFGIGTQKVEEETKKAFEGVSVLRMDMDTTGYKNAHEEILTEFKEKNVNILIGTQMIAKGHDFPNVTLVGVLSADALLESGDYRSTERTFQLVTQVAGRAGRGTVEGRVCIQAYNTEDFSIVAASKHDFESFYNQEIRLRQTLAYPPFVNIGVITISSIHDNIAMEKAKEVLDVLTKIFTNDDEILNLLGPVRAPLSRLKGKYRWRVIIKHRNSSKLTAALTLMSDQFTRANKVENVQLGMDVNPFSML